MVFPVSNIEMDLLKKHVKDIHLEALFGGAKQFDLCFGVPKSSACVSIQGVNPIPSSAFPMIPQVFSIEVGEKVPGETRVRRSILSPDKLVETPAENVNTLYDVLRYSAHHYGDRNGFGYRKLLGTVQEEKEVMKVVNGVETTEKKTWSYFKLSDYYHYSYQEAAKITQTIGSGLKQLGMKKGDKLEIFAMTR
jgi:hypothetical protein